MPIVSLSTQSLIKNNFNQVQSDTAYSSNNLVCTAYTEVSNPIPGEFVYAVRFAVADATTGQNYIAPTTNYISGSSPRVFTLGNYFIIVYAQADIPSGYSLYYIAVNTNNLSVGTPTLLTNTYLSNAGQAQNADTSVLASLFDGVVLNSILYLFWNASGPAVKALSMGTNLSPSSVVTIDNSNGAGSISVCADPTGNTAIWVAYWQKNDGNSYVAATYSNLVSLLSPTLFFTGNTITNLATSATSGICTIIYEVPGTYAYDTSIATNLTSYNTVTQGGTVGTAATLARGTGIASKALLYSGTIYVLLTYQSEFQSTYFLANLSGQVVSKIAWENGAGYQVYAVPAITLSGTQLTVSYLQKDFIEADGVNAQDQPVFYSQTGINEVTFTFSTSQLQSIEAASNLHFNGGFLFNYDANIPVEQNFFLFPDYVEATTTTSTQTPTGTIINGGVAITGLTDMAGIAVGQIVSGTAIPSNTYVVAVDYVNSIVVMSAAATGNHTETITFTGSLIAQTYQYIATYEWSDNQGNIYRSEPSLAFSIAVGSGSSTNTVFVPTLRLTYKTANPVKIVIYRWSTAQQSFFQVSSQQNPILNSTTTDYITFYDSTPDTLTQVSHVPIGIDGNNLLYTTGGVVENVGPPPFSAMALFNGRLCALNAEVDNEMWFSQVIVPATPVEMSDLLTYQIPPTIGVNQNVGNAKCLYPMDDKLIFFFGANTNSPGAINYITGNGPDETGANSDFPLTPIFVTATVGCSNQASIVRIPSGLLFQSNDKGIYRLQRSMQTDYIGQSVESLVQGYTITSSALVPQTTYVLFCISSGNMLMYDWLYDQWAVWPNLASVSSTIYNGLHTFITSAGQIQQYTPGNYYDGTSGGSNPVLIGLTTGWLSLAQLQGYERLYEFYVLGEWYSQMSLTAQVAYDFNPSYFNSSTFTPANVTPLQWRIHAKQQLCQSFQVSIQENFSASMGTAGEGLALSGLNLKVGIKGAQRPIRGSTSTGLS
jgi:hypothetical protein